MPFQKNSAYSHVFLNEKKSKKGTVEHRRRVTDRTTSKEDERFWRQMRLGDVKTFSPIDWRFSAAAAEPGFRRCRREEWIVRKRPYDGHSEPPNLTG